MRYFEATEATPKAAFRQMFGQVACVVVAGVIAVLLRTDYNFFGILAIAVFYIFRHSKKMMILLGCLVFFMDTVNAGAKAEGMSVGGYLIVFFVGLNFVFELIVNILLSPAILRIINIKKR